MYKFLLAISAAIALGACGKPLPTICNGSVATITEDCQGIRTDTNAVIPQLHFRIEGANVDIMLRASDALSKELTSLGCTWTPGEIWNCSTSPLCE
jgi:hypothetical protein